tara:strand:- start:171 stop:398 length:228 start_codon:yes stop_codon:yes gene_type:complete
MITSKLQEVEFALLQQRNKYEKVIDEIIDIISRDQYDEIEKYEQIVEFIEEFVSVEPTTADEFNKGDDIEYNYDK